MESLQDYVLAQELGTIRLIDIRNTIFMVGEINELEEKEKNN